MNDESDITLKRRIDIYVRMLRAAWEIRPQAVAGYFGGVIAEIAGMLGSIYATARLGALLAQFVATGETGHYSFVNV